MENKITEYEEFDLREIKEVIKKNKCFIFTSIVVGILLGFIASGAQRLSNPVIYTYQAKTTLELTNGSEMKNQPQLLLYIIESKDVLVSSMAKLKITSGTYVVDTAVSTKPNQFDVIVEGPNKDVSIKLADEVVAQSREIASEAVIMSRNSVVEKATVFGNPIQNSKKINLLLNIMIGTILGTVGGFFLIFSGHYMGGKVHTTSELEKALGTKVIGVIPNQIAEKKYVKFIKVR